MKRNAGLSSLVIILSVLYCYSVTLQGRYYNYFDTIPENHNIIDWRVHISDNSAISLLSAVNPSGASGESLNLSAAPGNIITGEFSIALKIGERIVSHYFIQYTNLSKNFLLKYYKSKKIFPHHYFW